MTATLDTNVVVSGIFWPGEARQCLVLWAKRKFELAVTDDILKEYREIATRLRASKPQVNPEPWLRWIERKAKLFEPSPVGKQRSRDQDDDVFLACALASAATIVVSRDEDLLVLGRPFGIEILRPREFLKRF